MGRTAEQRLQEIIEPVVTALGYEFVGLEYLAQGRHSLLRVYIDSEQGITVDDCGTVSHQLSAVLDVEDPIQWHYTLEVSSPGLDRPLFTKEHFERFSGNEVKLRLLAPDGEGRRKFRGLIKGVRENEIVVEVDGSEYTFPIENIEKANLVPQW